MLNYFNENKDLHFGRQNEALVKRYGKRKAFIAGHNSTDRYHVRLHFDIYKTKCKEAGLPVHHHAIPRDIWKKLQEKAQGKTKGTGQQTLDASFKRVDVPKGFTQDGILHAVAKFVAVDDQVRSSPIPGNVG